MTTASPHIDDMRAHLMAALASLRDRENPMEPDRARAMAQVASVLVDTARVEVDYIKATGADRSDFLEGKTTHQPALPNSEPQAHNPFPNVVQHKLRG